MRWCLLLALAVVTLLPARAGAQGSDSSFLGRFVVARDRYEEDFESVRQGVLTAVERATDAARKKKGADAAEIARLAAQRDAFVTRGEWPSVPGIPALRRQAAAAARTMDKAYGDAIDALLKDRQDAAAAEFQSSRDTFRSENDLVPWGDNLVAGKSLEQRTIGDGHEPMRVIAPESPRYRVEVMARPVGGSAGIVLEYTAGGDPKTSASEATLQVQTLVTTLEADPQAGFAQVLQIRSVGGPMIVERLRLKPVPAGSIDDLGPEPAPRDNGGGGERQSVADLMPKGSIWRGTVTHNQQDQFQTRMEVISSTSDEVIMRGNWVGEVALEFQFKARGTSIRLVGVRETSRTGGTRTGCKGSGSVRDKTLTSTYSWRVSGGDLRNMAISGSMKLERE